MMIHDDDTTLLLFDVPFYCYPIIFTVYVIIIIIIITTITLYSHNLLHTDCDSIRQAFLDLLFMPIQ